MKLVLQAVIVGVLALATLTPSGAAFSGSIEDCEAGAKYGSEPGRTPNCLHFLCVWDYNGQPVVNRGLECATGAPGAATSTVSWATSGGPGRITQYYVGIAGEQVDDVVPLVMDAIDDAYEPVRPYYDLVWAAYQDAYGTAMDEVGDVNDRVDDLLDDPIGPVENLLDKTDPVVGLVLQALCDEVYDYFCSFDPDALPPAVTEAIQRIVEEIRDLT